LNERDRFLGSKVAAHSGELQYKFDSHAISATLQHAKHFLSGVFRSANVVGIHEGTQ
jgi:hypothetical protein